MVLCTIYFPGFLLSGIPTFRLGQTFYNGIKRESKRIRKRTSKKEREKERRRVREAIREETGIQRKTAIQTKT